METSPSTNGSARIMATFLIVAGVAHFANPTFFDDIVPPWLPPSERFWTYASGVAELAVGIGLLSQRTRSRAAWAAFFLFLAVYPANLYMAWDWRDKAVADQLVAAHALDGGDVLDARLRLGQRRGRAAGDDERRGDGGDQAGKQILHRSGVHARLRLHPCEDRAG